MEGEDGIGVVGEGLVLCEGGGRVSGLLRYDEVGGEWGGIGAHHDPFAGDIFHGDFWRGSHCEGSVMFCAVVRLGAFKLLGGVRLATWMMTTKNQLCVAQRGIGGAVSGEGMEVYIYTCRPVVSRE